MTASFTHSCTRLARIILALVVAVTGIWPLAVHAAGIEVRQASLMATDEGFELAADFAIDFPDVLEDAVNRGVALYFVAEFELQRPRWYWFDERTVHRTQTWRLSYHALTRQYRVSRGPLHQNFATLSEALDILSRVRRWQVAERRELSPGETYQAALRFQLDLGQMPKPFQINAIANRDWELGSNWYRFPFSPGSASAAVSESR